MASCIHGYLPVGRAAAAIQEMARIRILMQESHVGEPMSVEFKNEVLSSISKAISALDYGETSEPGRSPVGSRGTSKFSDDRKRGISSGSRRGGWRKRSPSSSWRKVLTITPEDGLAWRKYGEKEIQNSTYPRSYFRCTHKYDQGCMATRQVQQSKEDPSKFVIIYKGEHTCSGNPSTIPQIIETTSSPKDSHLISFGSNTIPPPPPPVHSKQETQLVSSSSSAKHDCCNEDDVASNPTPGGSPAEFFTASFESSFGNLDMGFTASSLFDFELEDFSQL
ncbi:transcription factor WRKY45-1-like isoform X2 [Typha angustifolia]|uniref:transcription factor WRKY45-1-like isoform X2 n=1 Tax=Typha angustifolia TaxID=59011 RepID=UPI003C2B5C51